MYRTKSPFANFPRPHELLSAAAAASAPAVKSLSTAASNVAQEFQDLTAGHSRQRNRSSGGSSVGTTLFDSEADPPPPRSFPRISRSRSRSRDRSMSPTPGVSGGTPLLPLHDASRSRSVTPEPGRAEWRFTGAQETGLGGGWNEDGKLGWWLWNTQRGWGVYIGTLVVLYSVSSYLLLLMNRFILLTGVYKFPYPLTTTLLSLLFTHLLLLLTASLTRSFSRSLHSLGLSSLIAPSPLPSKGKGRANLRAFTSPLLKSGSIFQLLLPELLPILPLSLLYIGKITLSSLAFGFTQLQIYQLSRAPTLILCLLFTYLFNSSHQSLSITTLSSSITMVLALVTLSVRSNLHFAIEGFLAGLFSTLFVAAYPIALSRTWRSWSQSRASLAPSSTALDLEREESRSAWKLLHYINFTAIIGVAFLAVVSGEVRDIMRNCYILDVAWFWIMAAGAGVAAWAVFVSGFLLVRATTPVTVVVTSYPRAAVQTVLLGGKVGGVGWVGVAMCWASAGWYLVGRRREGGRGFFSLGEERGEGRSRRGGGD